MLEKWRVIVRVRVKCHVMERTMNPHQLYKQSTSHHIFTVLTGMHNASNYLVVAHLPKHLRVTDRGMQLSNGQSGWERDVGDVLHRVYFLQPWVFEQTEPSNTENGMEDIHHVSRAICEPAKVRILHPSASHRPKDYGSLPGTAI
jgi:hypothetical protein